MVWPKIIAVLAALPPIIVAVASTETSPDPYTYYGCVAAVPGAFPHLIAHAPAAGLSISACQDACSHHGRFVAFGSQQCRCSVEGPYSGNPVSFQVLDRQRCSEPCVKGDPSQGMCGGGVGTGAWSLWVRGDIGSTDLKRQTHDDTPDDLCGDDAHAFPPGPSTLFGTATSTLIATPINTAVVLPTGAASQAGVGALAVALGFGAMALVV